jgi:hypothetical protein
MNKPKTDCMGFQTKKQKTRRELEILYRRVTTSGTWHTEYVQEEKSNLEVLDVDVRTLIA